MPPCICSRLYRLGPRDDPTIWDYADLLDGTCDVVDRVVLNGYLQLAQSAGGFRTWWRWLHDGDDNLDNTHLMRMAGRFSRRLLATPTGLKTVAALLVLRDKVIKPVLAGADRSDSREPAQNLSPIDEHYRRMQTEMRQLFHTLGIAA